MRTSSMMQDDFKLCRYDRGASEISSAFTLA